MVVIGPPTLDFGPKMLTSNIPITASSAIVFTEPSHGVQ
jgi:hypothetical protein